MSRERSLSWARLTCVVPIGTSWDNDLSVQTQENDAFRLRNSSLTIFAHWAIAASLRRGSFHVGGSKMTRLQKLAVGAAALVGLLSNLSAGAPAQTIIEEWSSAKFPAPPALKPAAIVANETALLVMDFTNQTCTNERRPRCDAGAQQGRLYRVQRRSARLGPRRHSSGAHAGSRRTGAAALGTRQVHRQRFGEDPQGQRHQDGGGHGDAGADLGPAYGRCGRVARIQGNRAGRWHVRR